MSDLIVSAGVPEVIMGSGVGTGPVVPPTFSGKWEDMEQDLANIAAEQQPAQPEPVKDQPQAAATEPAVVAQPSEPVRQDAAQVPQAKPQEAKPSIEVPDKFKGPDGKLDQEKVLKSYLEAEKALHRAQNAKAQPQATQAAPVTTPPAQEVHAPANLSPFEAQVAQDIFSGGGFTEQQAISMARVQVKLAEAKHQADVAATFSRVSQMEQTLQEQARSKELEVLAKDTRTNWVLTPEGQSEMIKARQDNPYLNQSPEPWRAAALYILAQRSLNGGSAPVMPIPPGGQQTAPQLPVSPTPPPSNPVALDTPQQVAAYVSKLNPAQEAEFWQKMGLRWDSPTQFKGV